MKLSKLIIQQVHDLPGDIRGELYRSATEEDFKPLRWLIDEWENTNNRFTLPGEALYEARSGNRLVGICGLNRDPFRKNEKLGRLRRLYVLPEFRRRGVGKQLVSKAIQDAIGVFAIIRLMTLDENSAKFFEAVGFQKVEDEERASHIVVINSRNDTIP